MAHPDYLMLEEMFSRHRKSAFVVCDETCFCWEVETWLNLEAAQHPANRCPECGGKLRGGLCSMCNMEELPRR